MRFLFSGLPLPWRRLGWVACLLAVSFSTHAQELPQPEGSVILTVSGLIERSNTPSGEAEFDRAMLESLAQVATQTQTPWAEGVNLYEGPLIRAVADAVGANGQTLVITALNDYSAEMPVSDLYEFDVILALKMNQAYMRVRDKGPLFVIYPFDQNPVLKSELYYNRSVWQIKAIEFK
ncbi:hypothetical protein [Nitrincola tapanii]|uniref:Oxidoreductase molybdopterin-binding domain-containing protein n=1 Tax=Nitrincola tapanii TaxID=1708751 RepID=A0A5A9W599_9GAMM|nr:hypothetical protein [Nitrincola tapanii]KAA0875713.1 hypothetical protein E1H14_03195 [Nitrincola tapanii]